MYVNALWIGWYCCLWRRHIWNTSETVRKKGPEWTITTDFGNYLYISVSNKCSLFWSAYPLFINNENIDMKLIIIIIRYDITPETSWMQNNVYVLFLEVWETLLHSDTFHGVVSKERNFLHLRHFYELDENLLILVIVT